MPPRERTIIAQIRKAAKPGASVLKGIGDDCALLRVPAGHQLLVTTDFSIEGIHFRREWNAPELVGWRCLARGLSDVAAMGGEPMAAFLSLALPPAVSQLWTRRFINGLLELADKFQVPLAGGDTSQSPSGIHADIVVVGSVEKGKAILRSGAKAGDTIYVTGDLGAPAAVISQLKARSRRPAGAQQKMILGNLRPAPRLQVGQWLRKRGVASAMIDISDGLSTDLNHICEESVVGAEIVAEQIPRGNLAGDIEHVDLQFALHGGDDYELLFTSSHALPAKIAAVNVTAIGKITARKGIRLVSAGKARRFSAQGWEHFKDF